MLDRGTQLPEVEGQELFELLKSRKPSGSEPDFLPHLGDECGDQPLFRCLTHRRPATCQGEQ